MKLEFICENDNIRLTEELKLHVSRRLYKNIKSNDIIIYVNGTPKERFKEIMRGDVISLEYDVAHEIKWDIYLSKLDVRYEDEDYLIVYKRGGLQSIPTKGSPYSLYQEALYYLKENNEDLSVSILNRLDRDTKGLVVIAKNRFACYKLSPTHEKMTRKYIALCEGIFKDNEGIIDTFINKEEELNKRFVSLNSGKRAITHYHVLKNINGNSLVEFVLDTGRTHQIRVHSLYLGHPIIGDSMYGSGDGDLKLFSYYVRFYHYRLNKEIEIKINEEDIKF